MAPGDYGVTTLAHGEGLKLARLLMVLSSVSPLFVLWAIRGTTLVPDVYFLHYVYPGGKEVRKIGVKM